MGVRDYLIIHALGDATMGLHRREAGILTVRRIPRQHLELTETNSPNNKCVTFSASSGIVKCTHSHMLATPESKIML